MNKIVSIKLPILALAMAFSISCTSDKDSGENLSSGSGGENLSSSNEQSSSSSSIQSSSSSSVQSSSSGISDMCCPDIECLDLSDFTVRYRSNQCIQPRFDGEEYRCPPGGAICSPNESSSSGISHSCPFPTCYECNESSGLCKGYFHIDYPDYPDWPRGCVGLADPSVYFYYPLPQDGNPLPPDGRFCVPELDKSSSSSSVQSSSSHMILCKPTMVGTGTEYVSGCVIPEQLFTDARDGKIYEYVEIGTQTWMVENLDYAAAGSKCGSDVTTHKYMYGLSDANTVFCNIYGRLYDWVTAMNLPTTCNASICATRVQPKHQGICPSGWHLPSNAEWEVLMTTVGGEKTAGKFLKATSGWSYQGNSGNGEDKYGFRALPGGNGDPYNVFLDNVGEGGNWWSATEYDAISAYSLGMGYDYDNVDMRDGDKSYNLLSVRCIKD